MISSAESKTPSVRGRGAGAITPYLAVVGSGIRQFCRIPPPSARLSLSPPAVRARELMGHPGRTQDTDIPAGCNSHTTGTAGRISKPGAGGEIRRIEIPLCGAGNLPPTFKSLGVGGPLLERTRG